MNRTARQMTALTMALGLSAVLGGCAATGLTDEALTITKAESAATIAHLSATEPEFASNAASSAGWAVIPGDMNYHSYLIGGGGGDGLVYTSGNTEPTGYTRHVKLSLGIGSLGQYADYVVFFNTPNALNDFKGGTWSVGGEAGASIFGLGASGQSSFTPGRTVFADPRVGGGAAVFFTFDNYSYNDISSALSN
jgi:hypothetical protein